MKENMKLVLEGVEINPIYVSWDFSKEYKSAFSEIYILTDIQYSLKGDEKIYVIFTNQTLIKDMSGNSLANSVLFTTLPRTIYISSTADAIGSSLATSTVATFVTTVGLNPFKSARSFWVFINMLQLISFLPVINCIMPGNLELFITKFFGVSKASIPFESLPSWVPNPLAFLDSFSTEPLNENFANDGYTSLSFIYNFSSQLMTLFSILMLYLSLCIFSRIVPEFL